MAKVNPLDPLGLLDGAKKQLDQVAEKMKLPKLPDPPGMGRIGNPSPRGSGLPRLLDPLGLFTKE